MEGEKKLYNIFHSYDDDGGFGDAIPQEDLVATVMATKEEIEEFIDKWDKPEVYAKPYAKLWCHSVYAEEVKVVSLENCEPYEINDPSDTMLIGIKRMKEREETKK